MRKKKESYIKKTLKNKKSTNIIILTFKLIFAFIFDLLRIIKNIFLTVFILAIILGTIGSIIIWNKIEPTVTNYWNFAKSTVEKSTEETFIPEQSTYIYDSNGIIIAKIKNEKDAIYLNYNEIPTKAINAFIAVEDRSYWENPGIDIKGIIRVGIDFIKTKGKEAHGASTITQQLARNIFLTHEVSIERKAKEILISLELTKKYSKEKIMEYYVNNICFSNSIYGLEAASIAYFNKSSSELTLSQICYLCAIPNAPEYYNPYKNPERAITRRDKILGDMLEEGYITQIEYDNAIKEKIIIEKPTYTFNNYLTTYAIDCAVECLMEKDYFNFEYQFNTDKDKEEYQKKYNIAYKKAKDKLYSGGYKIYTTLNIDIQTKMQEILDNNLNFNQDINTTTNIYELQGAMTIIDNTTGKVIALVGGRSQENNSIYTLNRAYQSFRQPGSTIKPLVVYLPALQNGYIPETVVYNINVSAAKEEGVDVQSLTGKAMSLRSALEQSKNGVAWQLFDKFGANYCLSFLEKMNFEKLCEDDYCNSSSLGGLTYGVSTLEMASAYSTIENHGIYRKPTCIETIYTAKGGNIYKEKATQRIYNPKAADTMTNIMTGVLTNGTAKKLNWYDETSMIAACKTGTTNDSKDGWFCGYTPYYTVSVWVGFDTPKELDDLYGSTYPGTIWKQSMLELINDKEVITEFEPTTYTKEDIEEIKLKISKEIAYDEYKWEKETKEIYEGYTVYDYRYDKTIAEKLQIKVIDKLKYSKSSTLYEEGLLMLEEMIDEEYKMKMKKLLDSTYFENNYIQPEIQDKNNLTYIGL